MLIFSSAFLASSFCAFAGYYDTLPKGVRLLEYRYIQTDTVTSEFSRNKIKKDYQFDIPMDSSSLENLNTVTADIFNYLKSISPTAYEKFSFGEYRINGKGNVSVQVAGLAYGLTNRTTVYAGLPIYKGRVTLDIERTKDNNHAQVASVLQQSGNTAEAQVFADFASQLPDANGELLQSALVNYLGYKPIGNWNATGLGDLELGMTHRFTSWDNGGLAFTVGLIAPTGRTDDPDILQDIPFGDGQWDAFGEFGGGIIIPKLRLSLDSFFRYTYQMPSTKVLRVAENADFPEIATEKGKFKESLGFKFDYNLLSTVSLYDWVSPYAGYIFNYQASSKYESEYKLANQLLSQGTEAYTHSAIMGANFSTVNAFKRGKFFMPFTTDLSAQRSFDGLNTPRYTRYNVKFRFYF